MMKIGIMVRESGFEEGGGGVVGYTEYLTELSFNIT